MSKSIKGSLHAHGCTKCHLRYEDACHDPPTDGTCMKCRGGKPWQELIDSRAPKECCFKQSRLANKDDIKTYRLAGKHLWHICKQCKRTHPTRPVLHEGAS